jgi:hypothetical protein
MWYRFTSEESTNKSLTGQSVVLWSRLHLLTNSRVVLRYTLYMIIANVLFLHVPTTVLTFGANSNNFSPGTLSHFVNGYSIMEKIQMVGFFIQEVILSLIYIKETLRLLKLSESVQDDLRSVVEEGDLRQAPVRRTMYQLIAINVIIIVMDVVVISLEFANLYLIEIVLKGAVYSIKLKLEFAVLGKLVQIVVAKHSDNSGIHSSLDRRFTNQAAGNATGLELEKKDTRNTSRTVSATGHPGRVGSVGGGAVQAWPSFVDPKLVHGDVTHAPLSRIPSRDAGENEQWEVEGVQRNRRHRMSHQGSWIDEEMVSFACVFLQKHIDNLAE